MSLSRPDTEVAANTWDPKAANWECVIDTKQRK
jgi:hypothetical protein